MDKLISNLAHDLKEPVRTILMFTELLEEDLGRDLPDAARRDLEFITASARRAQELVEDLLRQARAADEGAR